MESGYHSAAWFELGTLFDRPDELHPFVSDLARRLRPHGVDAVCGPLTGGAKLARLVATELRIECFEAERLDTPGATGLFPVRYELRNSQREQARGRSVAIVDDAISAGSAVRGTYKDLIACGARPVALGALIVFGDAAARFAAETGLALEGIERMPRRDVGTRQMSALQSGRRGRHRQRRLISADAAATAPDRWRSRRSRVL